jgi:hypothetical protein
MLLLVLLSMMLGALRALLARTIWLTITTMPTTNQHPLTAAVSITIIPTTTAHHATTTRSSATTRTLTIMVSLLLLLWLLVLPASASTILCYTMLTSRLAKQLASFHATNITCLKLMSSSLSNHN